MWAFAKEEVLTPLLEVLPVLPVLPELPEPPEAAFGDGLGEEQEAAEYISTGRLQVVVPQYMSTQVPVEILLPHHLQLAKAAHVPQEVPSTAQFVENVYEVPDIAL